MSSASTVAMSNGSTAVNGNSDGGDTTAGKGGSKLDRWLERYVCVCLCSFLMFVFFAVSTYIHVGYMDNTISVCACSKLDRWLER
jgi:hypothetical protein